MNFRDSQTPASAWLLVALLWPVAMLNYLDRQIIFSMLPLLQTDLKLSDAQLGLLSSVFLWIYGALSPVAGFWGDRFGRVRIVLASLVVWSIATWATGYSRNVAELLGARALMGVSEAFYLPAALALIADAHGPRTRSLATGLHFSGVYAGIVVGGAGGGWMGEHYGWRAAFTLLGGIGLLYTLLLKFTLREPALRAQAPEPPRLLRSVQDLWEVKGFLVLTGVFTTWAIANWIVYTWLPLYLYERFHMSLTAAGFDGTFYVQAGSVAGILAGGWLADTWSRRTNRGRIFTQVVGFAAAAPFLFLVGFTASLWLLILALIIFGIGRGMYDCNAMPVACQIVRQEQRATAYGIFNCAGCIVGGVMAAAAGYLKAALGLNSAFMAAAIVLAGAATVLVRLRITESPIPATRPATGNKAPV